LLLLAAVPSFFLLSSPEVWKEAGEVDEEENPFWVIRLKRKSFTKSE